MRFLNTSLAPGLAACALPASQPTNLIETVTVAGQSYDVQYDPYEPNKAIIFGRPSLVLGSLPKAQIVEAATPCLMEERPFVQEFSYEPHPSRTDLEPLAVVQLDCGAAS